MARNLTTGLQRGLRRSIAGGLGANDLFSTAPLDLRFAQQKTLDPRVTFTRASSGTYVDSEGVIRQATTNLLLRSEEFETTWLNYGTLTFSANAAASPTGASTADRLTDTVDVSNQAHQLLQGASLASSVVYTLSVYAKRETAGGLSLGFAGSGAFSTEQRAVFNLVDLTSTSVLGSPTNLSIISAGNGWYRCSASFTPTSSATGTASIRLYNSSMQGFYTGTGDQSLLLWGAQLEQSSTVGEYIPTGATINSAPRFDHNPTTGESLGLLVEEQRTNLLLRSEEFDTTWTTSNASVSGDAQAAPNGTTTADKLVEDATASNIHAVTNSIPVTSGAAYTWSIYCKAAERSRIVLSFANQFSANSFAEFDTSAGTIVSTGALGASNVTMQPLINGWYRLAITGTASSTATSTLVVYMSDGVSISYTGDGTSGLFLWGAQLEAGAFPTSYIPTTTATATRAADVASISGSNFSSWYRQDEGTVFVAYQGREGNASKRVFAFTDDSFSNNAWLIASNSVGSQANYWQVQAGGVVQAELGSGAYSAVPQLSAAAYRADDFGFSKNGGAPLTDTSGSIPVVNTLRIGAGPVNTGILNGTIRRLTYWPTRLPDDTLQTITV